MESLVNIEIPRSRSIHTVLGSPQHLPFDSSISMLIISIPDNGKKI